MTRSESYSAFRTALSMGKIKRALTCENCGSNKEIDGHHEDYSQPLVVTWLCRSCHQKLHYMKDPGRVGRMKATRKQTQGLNLDDYQEFYRKRRAREARASSE